MWTAWSHLSDLDWNKAGEQVIDEFKKGDTVKAVVLDVDVEKERISLGIKQVSGDPFATKSVEEGGDLRKGGVVTCEILEVKDGGLEVKIAGTDLTTFIKRNELARDRGDQRPDRFAVGEKIDARVTQFDRKAHKVAVSIKGARSRRGEAGDRAVRLRRFRRIAWRHSRRRAEGSRHRREERCRQGGRRCGRRRRLTGAVDRSRSIIASRGAGKIPAPHQHLARPCTMNGS